MRFPPRHSRFSTELVVFRETDGGRDAELAIFIGGFTMPRSNELRQHGERGEKIWGRQRGKRGERCYRDFAVAEVLPAHVGRALVRREGGHVYGPSVLARRA